MSIYAWISLANAVVAMAMGDLVFDEDRRSPLNRAFAVLCGFLVVWAFSEFMYRQADGYATAHLWVGVNKFAWRFTIAELCRFTLVFTGRPRFLANRFTYLALYGSAAVLSVIDVSTHMLSLNPVTAPWGYVYFPATTALSTVARLWAVGLALAAVGVMWGSWATTTGRRKRQTKIIALGLSYPVVAGVFEVASQAMKLRAPEVTTVSFAWLAIFVGYAVRKYQLFSINPAAVVGDILATMTDGLLLADTKGLIVTVNLGAEEMLGYKAAELIGRPVCSLFVDEMEECAMFDRLVAGSVIDNRELTLVTAAGTRAPVLFSGTPIRDRSGGVVGVVGVAKNIIELKISAEALREERDRALKYLEIAGVLVVVLHTDGTVAMINKKGCELLGYDESRILGRDWFDVFLPNHSKRESRSRFDALTAGEGDAGQYHEGPILTKDGEERLIAWRSAVLRNETGDSTAVMFSGDDLSDRRRAEALEHLAHYDYLTNLPNRALLRDRLGQALAFAQRSEKMLAVLFLDIDDFKGVNDMYGHDAGDRLLRAVSVRLADSVRRGDTVARMGGDEFAVALVNVKNTEEVAAIAKKIIAAVAASPYGISGYEIRSSTSIGISIYPQDADDPESLLNFADGALMLAKELGKNNYQFYLKQAA